MVLEDVAATAKPETILGRYRQLIANEFDGSRFRRGVGRPKLDQETERLNMGAVRCRERLGGLLKYNEREAA